MRKLLLLLMASILGIVGFIQVAPSAEPGPDFGDQDLSEEDGAVASPSAWYCPWVEAGDVVDTNIVLGSDATVDVAMTLLDPISNTDPTEFLFDLVGPAGSGTDVGTVARRGESPATIEISDGAHREFSRHGGRSNDNSRLITVINLTGRLITNALKRRAVGRRFATTGCQTKSRVPRHFHRGIGSIRCPNDCRIVVILSAE